MQPLHSLPRWWRFGIVRPPPWKLVRSYQVPAATTPIVRCSIGSSCLGSCCDEFLLYWLLYWIISMSRKNESQAFGTRGRVLTRAGVSRIYLPRLVMSLTIATSLCVLFVEQAHVFDPPSPLRCSTARSSQSTDILLQSYFRLYFITTKVALSRLLIVSTGTGNKRRIGIRYAPEKRLWQKLRIRGLLLDHSPMHKLRNT